MSTRGCLIGRPAGAFEALMFRSGKLVPAKAHGFMRHQDRALVILKHHFMIAGELNGDIGNYGVEVQPDGPNQWILRFCEGTDYIQFDALVVRVLLYDDGELITDTEWGPKNMAKALKKKVTPADFFDLDDPRILNP